MVGALPCGLIIGIHWDLCWITLEIGFYMTLLWLGMLKVESIVDGSNWKWPPTITIYLMEMQETINFQPNALIDDSVNWSLSSNGKFSIKSAWNEWRDKKPKVL